MPTNKSFSFTKEERLYKKKQIDALFGGGKSRALTAFPIRLVYSFIDSEGSRSKARVLISVPKRHLKHAVDRNRVKRQLREAYRLNKHIVIEALEQWQNKEVHCAFVWLDNKLHNSALVHSNMVNLLTRLAEKGQRQYGNNIEKNDD